MTYQAFHTCARSPLVHVVSEVTLLKVIRTHSVFGSRLVWCEAAPSSVSLMVRQRESETDCFSNTSVQDCHYGCPDESGSLK